MESPEQQNNKNNQELINIEWQALEFKKHEKGPGWFIMAGIIGLAFFTVALLMKNLIFGIIIILSVSAIFLYALKSPRLVRFKITGAGISIDDQHLPYPKIRSFWIFYEPPVLKELSLKTKNWSMPLLKIPLEGQNPSEIRDVLIKFVPEEEQEQSLVDILADKLKF